MARRRKVFTNGKLHIQRRMCETCIFRPGAFFMDVRRRDFIEEAALKIQGCIPCHETLDGQQSVCHGYYLRNKEEVMPLKLASLEAFQGGVEWTDPAPAPAPAAPPAAPLVQSGQEHGGTRG